MTGPPRLSVLAVAVAALGACGRSPPSARFVGESTHFRLYVDPDVFVPPELEGENGLVALETAWSDAHTMLRMPDGKIAYYWLTAEHIPAGCGTPDEQACFWDQNMEIDSATLPNPHELNHAYMYLRKQRVPIPFLSEGLADAIGCELHNPMNVPDAAWQPFVASLRSPELYVQGGAFVRHLIRRFGIDEFVRYYEQSTEHRDPALFAANFSTFWGRTVDEIWTEITRPSGQPGLHWRHQDLPLLPAADRGRRRRHERSRARAVLDAAAARGTDAGADGRGGRAVVVQDCAGVQMPLRNQGVLARFDDRPRLATFSPRLETATIGPYLSDDCAAAAPYPFGPEFRSSANLSVGVSQPASRWTVYLQLTAAFSGGVRSGLNAICDSCGFDPGPVSRSRRRAADRARNLYGRRRCESAQCERRRREQLHQHQPVNRLALALVVLFVAAPARADVEPAPERRLFIRFATARVRLRELDPVGGPPGASYTGWGPALEVTVGRRVRPRLVIAGDLQLAAVVNRTQSYLGGSYPLAGTLHLVDTLSAIADYTLWRHPRFHGGGGIGLLLVTDVDTQMGSTPTNFGFALSVHAGYQGASRAATGRSA